MRFHFRLQKILELTELDEKRKRSELAREIQALEKQRNRYRHCETQLGQLMVKEREDGWKWAELGRELVLVNLQEMESLTQQMAAQVQAVQAARQSLLEVVKKKRGLETLKSRRKVEFSKEKAKREQRELEEFYNYGK